MPETEDVANKKRLALLEMKSAFERLQDSLIAIKEQVAHAEKALGELKVNTNIKLGAAPFIAGASVKSASNQID